MLSYRFFEYVSTEGIVWKYPIKICSINDQEDEWSRLKIMNRITSQQIQVNEISKWTQIQVTHWYTAPPQKLQQTAIRFFATNCNTIYRFFEYVSTEGIVWKYPIKICSINDQEDEWSRLKIMNRITSQQIQVNEISKWTQIQVTHWYTAPPQKLQQTAIRFFATTV